MTYFPIWILFFKYQKQVKPDKSNTVKIDDKPINDKQNDKPINDKQDDEPINNKNPNYNIMKKNMKEYLFLFYKYL
jgi:hypothetical protein